MNNLSVKKGDTVLVIAGKNNGQQGKVVAVSPSTNRVIVEGVNIITKAKKARTTQEKSELIKIEAPINASNVMVICPICGKATRIAHKEEGGKNVRLCKKCGAVIDAQAKEKKVAKKAVKAEKVEEKKTTKKTAKKPETTEETKKTTDVAEKKPRAKKATSDKA